MGTVFKEKDLKDITVGGLTKAMLATASAEKLEEFEKREIHIIRIIGTSGPPKILQQIRDKETGLKMWGEICKLYEGKQNETIRA